MTLVIGAGFGQVFEGFSLPIDFSLSSHYFVGRDQMALNTIRQGRA
jgi:hypothetical protein